jgi:hypothetical protein
VSRHNKVRYFSVFCGSGGGACLFKKPSGAIESLILTDLRLYIGFEAMMHRKSTI